MKMLALLARLVLGGMFVWLGLAKLADPVLFLKALREYDLVDHHVARNVIAGTLPWVEVIGGALLVLGVGVRGLALLFFSLLAFFTWAIAARALEVRTAEQIAFCAVEFDCGCGTGVQNVCRKLAENAGLLLCGLLLLVLPGWNRLALLPRLLPVRRAPPPESA